RGAVRSSVPRRREPLRARARRGLRGLVEPRRADHVAAPAAARPARGDGLSDCDPRASPGGWRRGRLGHRGPARHLHRRCGTGGLELRAGIALTVGLVVSIMAYDGGNWNLSGVLFFGLLGGAPWVFGRAIRHRREREHLLEERASVLERGREEDRRLAVGEERTRIAREAPDVLAHALGV